VTLHGTSELLSQRTDFEETSVNIKMFDGHLTFKLFKFLSLNVDED
jgi:hypothetical protein